MCGLWCLNRLICVAFATNYELNHVGLVSLAAIRLKTPCSFGVFVDDWGAFLKQSSSHPPVIKEKRTVNAVCLMHHDAYLLHFLARLVDKDSGYQHQNFLDLNESGLKFVWQTLVVGCTDPLITDLDIIQTLKDATGLFHPLCLTWARD